MEKNNFSWKVAGAAGDGILNAGLALFGKTCQRGGLNVVTNSEYPSLIRGGHNHLSVRVSDKDLHSHSRDVSLLLALNKESIDRHASKVVPGGGIIYDPDAVPEPRSAEGVTLFPVPMKRLATEAGNPLMKNTVGVGATFALLDCELKPLEDVIREKFADKGEAVVEGNKKAAKLGYDSLKGRSGELKFSLEFTRPKNTLMISGHEAIVAGAIKAGCKFYAAYPMTPATSILHSMARHEEDFGIVVKHTEDEIAAINMAIGASFAGARAMVGTSGGGFALMVEGFGMAAQTETPLVVVESQRPGPASGMATRTGQGDLRFMLNTSPDEFPRVIVAPGDVQECFSCTVKAFDLAEKYQLPVAIMTDKHIGDGFITVPEFDHAGIMNTRHSMITPYTGEGYLRYKNTESGISPRTIPGVKGGEFTASSYEHNEEGFECEDRENKVMMHKKRFRKFERLKKEVPQPGLIGPEDADITFISWGSPKGAILEAMKLLEKDGIKASLLQVLYLSPFPAEKVKSVVEKASLPVMVEGNMTSQLNSLIRENCMLDVEKKILRFDGRSFNPEDIYEEARKILGR